MAPSAHACLLILLMTILSAGCAAGPAQQATVHVTASLAAPAQSPAPHALPNANATAPRAVPVDVYYDEYVTPVGLPNPAACDPSRPWVCDAYYSGIANMTGTFSGRAQVWGHLHYNTPGSPAYANEQFSFTGNVLGCGSGSVVINGEGTFTPVADPSGGPLWVRANATLVPGSTSTGLANLVLLKAAVDQDRNFVAPGHMVGTMWC